MKENITAYTFENGRRYRACAFEPYSYHARRLTLYHQTMLGPTISQVSPQSSRSFFVFTLSSSQPTKSKPVANTHTDDEQELNRMDVEHHNQKLQIGGKLHLCPLSENATEILDLGCGTGERCTAESTERATD